MIRNVLLLRKHAVPIFLHIIQNERNELQLTALALVLRGIGLPVNYLCASLRRVAGEHLKQLLVEDQTQHADDDGAANPQMDSPDSAPAAAVIAPVFDIAART